MSRLDCNLSPPPPDRTRSRAMLSLAFLIACSMIAWRFQLSSAVAYVEDQQHAQTNRLAHQQRLTARPDLEDHAVNGAIDRIAVELTYPWITLLASLQRQAGPGIRLTGIQHDQASTGVRIRGSAQDIALILGFTHRLKESGDWEGIQQVSTEPAAGGGTIRFEVTARRSSGP